MLLAKVEGSVVATMKDTHVAGRKLLLVRPQLLDARDRTRFGAGADTLVAVDSVGAGVGELVVVCQGSPARLLPDLKEAPVDAVIMGIVDLVDVLGQQLYSSET
jgi:microcompartment protein CcmK/EutM